LLSKIIHVWYREERFRLDGERDELQTIRRELNALRDLSINMNQPPPMDLSSGNKENVSGGIGATSIPSWMGAWLSSGPGRDDMKGVPKPETSQGITTPELEDRLGGDSHRVGSKSGSGDGSEDDPEVLRLLEEKKTLVATGLYQENHPIIAELSRLIDSKSGRAALSFDDVAAVDNRGGGVAISDAKSN